MTNKQDPRTAALMIIGNEILSGRTQDKNANYIALNLSERGIVFGEVRVVPDIESKIIKTLNELRAEFDYVMTTGGIGPTHDDITAACVAIAFGVVLEKNADAYQMLVDHYGSEDEVNDARARMAMIPAGARLIPNPVSGAPGFIIGNVHVMAGVPAIMQAMFDYVLDGFETGAPILANSIACDTVESALAPMLAKLQAQYQDIDIGSYPSFKDGKAALSVVLRGTDSGRLKLATDDFFKLMDELGTSYRVLGELAG